MISDLSCDVNNNGFLNLNNIDKRLIKTLLSLISSCFLIYNQNTPITKLRLYQMVVYSNGV